MNKAFYAAWRDHPELYFKEALDVDTIEDYQVNVLKQIVGHKQVAIKACHSVGKTWTMARVALWFFGCYKNSIVITTAPTYNQVENLLWGELREAYKNSKIPVGGRLLNTKLVNADKWYCMGFSPQKSAGDDQGQKGSTFQGFHSDYVMVIFDEATGIPPDIWKMASGLMTSGKIVKFVAIANPTTRNCHFFSCFSNKAWKSLSITCFDSPNLRVNGFNNKDDLRMEIELLNDLSDNERLLRIANYKKPVPHLVSAEWVIEYILEWGIDHPLVVSKAFGEFPEEDDTVMIRMSYVEAAQSRDYEIKSDDARSIGVDVARYGSDKSVITELVGFKQTAKVKRAKQDTMEITGATIDLINNDNKERRTVVLVDATGIGSGVFDALLEAQNDGIISKDVELVEVHFGSSPVLKSDTDKEEIEKYKSRFVNLKSRMFQHLADDLKSHLDLFDDKIYLKELPMLKSKIDSKSKIRMESKDDYRKRTGSNSPDDSDSLALANLGRYVTISYGKFTDLKRAEIKKSSRGNKISRKSRIRPKEY